MAKGEVKKQTMVIEYVDPQPGDPWMGGNTPMWFPECRFADGSIGSGVAFSQSGALDVIKALQELVDVATEFEIEDNGEWNGKQKWKLKSYPGKPAGGGGGGGGAKGGTTMSHVHAGLLAAASALGPVLAHREGLLPSATPLEPSQAFADITELADLLIDWLFERGKLRGGQASEANGDSASDGQGAGEERVPAPAPAPPAADVVTLPQLTQLRKLGAAKGLGTNEAIAEAAGIPALNALTSEQADLLIEAWSA